MSGNEWSYKMASQFKQRDNVKEFKPSEAIVIGLEPVRLTILDGKVILTEDKNLIISEWFKKRWDIDKTTALSADVPDLLSQADAVTENHSYGGAPCVMPNAIAFLVQAITKVNAELLALKLDLKVNDKVIIVPSSQEDIFFLVDKVL